MKRTRAITIGFSFATLLLIISLFQVPVQDKYKLWIDQVDNHFLNILLGVALHFLSKHQLGRYLHLWKVPQSNL